MMLAFPQLASGAMAQMPFERAVRFRSRHNGTRDGSTVEMGDPDYEERTWQLPFRELSDAEWQALTDLFAAAEGRLKTFTFLEPGANLLCWSEKLAQAPWTIAGGVLDGQPDSLGGTRGSRLNAGSSAAQLIAAPSSYRYAASAWLRTSGGGAKLRVSDAAANVRETDIETSGQWKRYALGYAASSASDQMKLELVAGAAALDIHGPQLEAQVAASPYKVSSAQGGVFANARFDQDALTDEASGPARHDTRVRLIWTPSQI